MEDFKILKPVRLLYVEDDEFTRTKTQNVLSKFIDNVTIATNGQEGYNLFTENYSSQPFDIVLSDITMPKMNGIELARKIREKCSDVPIILLTAHSESHYLLEAINLQVSYYVIKPVNLPTLITNLQKAYLPIHQKELLQKQNEELKQLNEKIKETAKKELEKMQLTHNLLSDDEDFINFDDFIDNIKV